jgi:prepilin-type processing-associated H-X9-DG protein
MVIDASVRSRWIQAMAIAGVIVLAVLLLLPAVQQAREAARRTQSRNNLKQIGLALGSYHDTFQHWPAGGTFDQNGRGMHGWEIALFPYLEASTLHRWIDYEQPWDAPHNAGCYAFRLPYFINPSIDPSSTRVLRKNEFAISHYSASSNLLAANSGVKLTEIESRSETFAMGELGGDFVPWGCPYNWRPLRGLTDAPRTYGRIENIGGNFLMVDGSVRWIAPDASHEVLAKLRGSNLAGDEAARTQSRSSRMRPCNNPRIQAISPRIRGMNLSCRILIKHHCTISLTSAITSRTVSLETQRISR